METISLAKAEKIIAQLERRARARYALSARKPPRGKILKNNQRNAPGGEVVEKPQQSTRAGAPKGNRNAL